MNAFNQGSGHKVLEDRLGGGSAALWTHNWICGWLRRLVGHMPYSWPCWSQHGRVTQDRLRVVEGVMPRGDNHHQIMAQHHDPVLPSLPLTMAVLAQGDGEGMEMLAQWSGRLLL